MQIDYTKNTVNYRVSWDSKGRFYYIIFHVNEQEVIKDKKLSINTIVTYDS